MKKTISFAENAKEVETISLPQAEEAVTTTTSTATPEPSRMNEAEFKTLLAYMNRNNYAFTTGNIGETMEAILTPRTTEFFKLLPDLITLLTQAKRTDIVNALKPIVNSLVTLQDWNYIIYDVICFFQDIDTSEQEHINKQLKNLIPSKMNR